MNYRVRLSPAAAARLKQTDSFIAQRRNKRIQWLAANFEQLRPDALSERFAGTYKFKIGSYRLIYSIHHEERLIYIHAFQHRKDAYRQR